MLDCRSTEECVLTVIMEMTKPSQEKTMTNLDADIEAHAKNTERLRREIQKEIDQHSKWCGPNCQTFLPPVYMKGRLNGMSAASLQENYDSCHIFR
jgi:hypothetical protein